MRRSKVKLQSLLRSSDMRRTTTSTRGVSTAAFPSVRHAMPRTDTVRLDQARSNGRCGSETEGWQRTARRKGGQTHWQRRQRMRRR
eukprot:284202-Rhodomonas_salina.1